MYTGTIVEVVKRQPFRPFLLRMIDGRQFLISHPEFIFVENRVVGITEEGRTIYVEPGLIATLEIENPTETTESSS